MLHNGLPTRMELFRRQIIVSPKCVMCDQEDEMLDNLFLKCPFARALWFTLPQNIRSDAIPSVRQWLITVLKKCKAGNGQEDKVLKDISATLWVIWTNRNNVIFENKTADVQQAISNTKKLLTEWKTNSNDCLQNGSTTVIIVENHISFQNQNWQAIIIGDTKKRSCETNWNGGAFVIKSHLG